ncbi:MULTISPECIES: MerR family transcriptional regulator [unclassified Nocardioides]|uniref:MerR family transcriptional regulator n=1 Tax=unclassified Nocardioides TaxID=2615069 RepID=UPI002407232F|nr:MULTISPECIES: MerR family transcriptional regulator [unclassified Nocardioides]MDF9716087.1 MerR family transcriptional regulator [Nocardioides sp. ChNu-99]
MSDAPTHLQIGEVAARTGLSLRTIRYYDEMGLVAPSARTAGGFRLYTEPDLARLGLIMQMKPLGFTLDQMRDLLGIVDALAADADQDPDAAPDPDERHRLLTSLAAYHADAEERVTKVRRELATAEAFAADLAATLERADT